MSVSLSTSHRSSYLLIFFRHLQHKISVLNYLELYTKCPEASRVHFFLNTVYSGSKFVPAILETVSLCLLN